MLDRPPANPARTYDEAMARLLDLESRDDQTIHRGARTAHFVHGQRTALAVVLVHGLSAHPGEYSDLAPLIHERGSNVVVPRMPEHGDHNRLSTRQEHMKAEAVLGVLYEAVDAACGLGERVCVLGISMGGLLAAYAVQYRKDVARAVCVAPAFGIKRYPFRITQFLANVAAVLPNFYIWWNPQQKELAPMNAYPRVSTHALYQILRIAADVYLQAKREPFKGRSVVTVTNAKDPQVYNPAAHQVTEFWRRFRRSDVECTEFTDLPKEHDIIDPLMTKDLQPKVYPVLLSYIAGTPA